jgi:AcrR family transcriptional regulator
MDTRAAAAELTRERVLDAACEAFLRGWYDDVTLREVAADAGVALQTVVNHFGSKEALFGAAAERISERIAGRRWSVAAGDLDAAARALVDDYEHTGDFTVRTLALEGRVPVVQQALDRGRAAHEAWVRHVFGAALAGLQGAARARRLAQLVAATDVYTWKLLRRDRGLGPGQTAVAIRELLEAIHDRTEGGPA